MKANPSKLNVVQNFMLSLCRIFGHNWRYKDYSNWIKENGDDYDFKAVRSCTRCHQREYLYKEWQIHEQESPYDVARYYKSPKSKKVSVKPFK
jgi:hypothetical protein